MKTCAYCQSHLQKYQSKFCSNRCQSLFKYHSYIVAWKLGKESGQRGLVTKTTSAYVRRYLSEKFGEKCCLCGWQKLNPVTHKVPLEIDHIDGNAENNTEENLRLICPNCHALGTTFRNLNKGKGRQWRKKKYRTHTRPVEF